MNILIVDDDVACLEGLATALEPSRHSCDTFSNPLEALDSIKNNCYNVVITDIKMPNLNGLELINKIYAISPATRIIIITAYRDKITFEEPLKNRVQAVFSKPLDFNKLMSILEDA